MDQNTDVIIIGAGPLAIEMAVTFKLNGIPYLQFDKGQVAQMVYNFPLQAQFFSSTERIGIAGIPIQTPAQQKCTREEYLAYIRSVVMKYQLNVNTYEEVLKVEKNQDGRFCVETQSNRGKAIYYSKYLIISTGSTSVPRTLAVSGENLPHVSVKMDDPHKYFQKKVLIIGGKNSAAESALRCYQAGVKVSISLRSDSFEAKSVKYWLLPELEGRIARKEIICYFGTEVVEIFPDRVVLRKMRDNTIIDTAADFVIKAIGFIANMELCKELGIELSSGQDIPFFNHETMETNIAGAFVLGTITGGTQNRYTVFIENTHVHVDRILKTLCQRLGRAENGGEEFKILRLNLKNPEHLEE